ncbi:MAG: holo-ACP synthase [Spirochaetaceae bacterium]|nr:holo-ACP synthase [Spirochaetaceae bacterium]
MIIGMGIDIVKVERFHKWVENPMLASRFFHPSELSVLEKEKSQACQSLAARFACKEAFGKALGTGLRGMQLKDICVKSDVLGKPELCLYGSALDLFNKSGANSIHISLSHETEYSVACVILECK